MRFWGHGQHVRCRADGRTGHVKDIEGVLANILWDDGGPGRWLHMDELEEGPGEPISIPC